MNREKEKIGQAVQVLINVRCNPALSLEELIDLLTNQVVFDTEKHAAYAIQFFEMIYPALMKKFIQLYQIQVKDILGLYEHVKMFGETNSFKKDMENGTYGEFFSNKK